MRPERTLVEEIDSVAPQMLLAEIRNYLARFIFTGEDVFKKVEVLSGGERGRLALAKLALTRANLLLLDEPTNHLDIPSQEILQEVLAEYAGTVLLVSHDRYLIDALATQIWEIVPGQAALQFFEGAYSQYRAFQEAQKLAAEAQERQRYELHIATASASKARPASISSEERRRRARLKEVEQLITSLEEQLNVLTRRLENPPADLAKVQRLGRDYVHIQKELDTLMIEWESLHPEAN